MTDINQVWKLKKGKPSLSLSLTTVVQKANVVNEI